jgi:hypothetical protein
MTDERRPSPFRSSNLEANHLVAERLVDFLRLSRHVFTPLRSPG